MSNGNYFVGRPATYTEPEPAPAPAKKQEPQVTDAQKPVSAQPPGTQEYFVGHPVVNLEQKQQAQPGAAAQAPPPSADKNGPGFLAKCCPCLFGGGGAAK